MTAAKQNKGAEISLCRKVLASPQLFFGFFCFFNLNSFKASIDLKTMLHELVTQADPPQHMP